MISCLESNCSRCLQACARVYELLPKGVYELLPKGVCEMLPKWEQAFDWLNLIVEGGEQTLL